MVSKYIFDLQAPSVPQGGNLRLLWFPLWGRKGLAF